jgi:hypothetical protein
MGPRRQPVPSPAARSSAVGGPMLAAATERGPFERTGSPLTGRLLRLAVPGVALVKDRPIRARICQQRYEVEMRDQLGVLAPAPRPSG